MELQRVNFKYSLLDTLVHYTRKKKSVQPNNYLQVKRANSSVYPIRGRITNCCSSSHFLRLFATPWYPLSNRGTWVWHSSARTRRLQRTNAKSRVQTEFYRPLWRRKFRPSTGFHPLALQLLQIRGHSGSTPTTGRHPWHNTNRFRDICIFHGTVAGKLFHWPPMTTPSSWWWTGSSGVPEGSRTTMGNMIQR